jgi:ketosteroid isomerase-like protein
MAPRAVAARFYQALEDEETPAILELCAADVTIQYPAAGSLPYGGTWHGHDGVATFLDVHDQAEEILAFDVNQLIAEGDAVVAIGTFRGRAKPDGGEWATSFVHYLTITDGHLDRWEAFFDTAAALRAHR